MIRALTFGVTLFAAAAALGTVACRVIDLGDRGSRRRQRPEEGRRGEEAEAEGPWRYRHYQRRRLNVVAPGDLAHRNDRDREAHRGAGADRRLCDFRPVATPEQIEHLLAAIDCTAAMALREAGAVALAS